MQSIDYVVEKLNRMINTESAVTMTTEQEYYVSGLSDALQVVEDFIKSQLIIGRKYYVIVKSKTNPTGYVVKEMQLYRINYKEKVSYCFTEDYKKQTPDLILYSEIGLKKRVFNNYADAVNGIRYVDFT